MIFLKVIENVKLNSKEIIVRRYVSVETICVLFSADVRIKRQCLWTASVEFSATVYVYGWDAKQSLWIISLISITWKLKGDPIRINT